MMEWGCMCGERENARKIYMHLLYTPSPLLSNYMYEKGFFLHAIKNTPNLLFLRL
jgi:hypothetical protein